MSEPNGAGRKPFTMNLNPKIMTEFRKVCEEEGYLPARRIEVLMKKEMEANHG